MSKYKLPNGLIVELNDDTGETTVVGGGGRSLVPGSRLTPAGDLLGPAGPARPVVRASELPAPAGRGAAGEVDPDENVSLQVPQGRTAPSFSGGSQPLSELQPPPEGEAPLVREDPAGAVIGAVSGAGAGGAAARGIGGALGAAARGATAIGLPTALGTESATEGALAGAGGAVGGLAGRAVPAVAGRVAGAVGRVIQPSLRGAAEGAAVAGVPVLVHTGNPLAAAEAAAKGAATGAVLGHAAHGVAGIVRKALKPAAAEAVEAAQASEAPPPPEPPPFNRPAPSIGPEAETALDSFVKRIRGAGAKGVSEADPPEMAAMKAIVLHPTPDTLRMAVAAGVDPSVALHIARLSKTVLQ